MIEDFFALALRNIRGKGIRSWLTMIGIFIGIAAIVALISLGDGLQAAINEQFELLGTGIIYVMPGSMMELTTGGGGSLDDHDLEVLSDVRGVDKVGGMIASVGRIKYRDKTVFAYVAGMDPGTQDIIFDSSGVKIERGQKGFRANDRYKVFVGYEFWSGNIYDRPVGVGDSILIDDKRFEVIGEVSRIGNPSDDSQVYIPIKASEELFDIKDEYITAIVKVKANYDTEDVAKSIEDALRKDRGLDVGEENFQVQSLEQIMDATGIVLDAVKGVVVAIALISLFVGGVGILNTMYTSVLERTQEIGVMKAVGARNEDILMSFLIESGTLGLVGGAIGCLIGIGISKTVEYVAVSQLDIVLLKASVTPTLVFFALSFSFLVGSLSGALPAWQASKLKPVDALRYE